MAKLTYWYGIDAGALSKERQLGLLANLPRLQAQDQIMQGRVDSTDHEAVHDLFLIAYGDVGLADAERLKAMQALVQASCAR